MKISRNHDGRLDRRTDRQTDGQDDYYRTSADLVWRDPNNSLNMYFRDIERTQFQVLKFSKENNSVKIADGVMILVLCTLSDNVLYLFKVS